MPAATFDALKYARELENAGFTRQQAETQAEALRSAFNYYDEERKKDLATKGDVRESELRLQKEIETVRSEMKAMEIRLLKWQIGGWLALAAIMAKGFGWLGF